MTSRTMRRLAAGLVVAAAAVAGPAVAAGPAAAQSQTTIHPEWVDGCPGCPGPLFNLQTVLDERVRIQVQKTVASGLSGLAVAARTTDPVAARRLHDSAVTTLRGAAAQGGNTAYYAGDWDGDLCPRKPGPWPKRYWDESERWLSDGMTLLGRANVTGDAATLATAVKELDTGVAGFTALQGCA
jgi:anaerobic selenocysteine-containing dehydrogenase